MVTKTIEPDDIRYTVHESIQNIVISAVRGEDGDMYLTDPAK